MSWIGALKGVAFGDAWGYPNEFLAKDEITDIYPPQKFIVSDDTQMTLYLADALESEGDYKKNIKKEFLKWYLDSDNDRAPGFTCMTSLDNLLNGFKEKNDSKGNGSLMRVWPCAYVKNSLDISEYQSELTHHHKTATQACLIATFIVQEAERRHMNIQASFVYARELSSIIGANELVEAFDKVEHIGIDMGGWTADEALALSLYIASMKIPAIERLQIAATIDGDSDTVAAITGGFIGAFEGDVWPDEWMQRLEPRYRNWIDKEWKIDKLR